MAMALWTLITIVSVTHYMLPNVVGQMTCSTLGTTAVLAGCECNFLGACDTNGQKKIGLNIEDHLPKGLEMYGYVENAFSVRNLAYLCEENTVAILYDCNSRIPLFSAIAINGRQLNGADGNRPKKQFRLSRRVLYRKFQQSNSDYLRAKNREICYKKRSKTRKVIDKRWYRGMGSTYGPACRTKVAVHRGHMIASQYGIGNPRKKMATFVYTNVVPQFGDFNSGPWQIYEQRLIVWGKTNCAMNGEARNVQLFIVVGAIPSTVFGPQQTRYFGRGGFSNYQDKDFRVNVPEVMWTAACCTFEFRVRRNTWQAATKSTAFWRENVPGKSPCVIEDVGTLEKNLKNWAKRIDLKINLFPYSKECKKSKSYIPL